MLEHDENRKQIQDYHFQGMGAVSEYDVRFLCSLIDESRPKRFLEVGVASGMSSAFLLKALSRVSKDCHLDSVDLGVQYYVDQSKKVGYLIDEIIPNPECTYEVHRGKWAGDIEQIAAGKKYDMVFIDANHMHPWPTIDTILTLPLISPNTWVAHHDIALKDMEGYAHGIGPFNIYEAFPNPKKASDCKYKNIGAFQIVKPYQEYEGALAEAMDKPWTVNNPIYPRFSDQINAFVEKHYSADFAKVVRQNMDANNEIKLKDVAEKKSA